MEEFIRIKTGKFPPHPDEPEEIFEEQGFHGKNLCEYLVEKLPSKGIETGFYCLEDWGWWVDAANIKADIGVGVYCFGDPTEYAVTAAYTSKKKFKLLKFRFVDFSAQIDHLEKSLREIFAEDDEIRVISITPEFPL